jgi:uncharacterized protein YcbK (DUF882 family)
MMLHVLWLMLLIAFPPVSLAETDAGRFFLMGDGTLHIRNAHTGKEAHVSVIGPDGSLDDAAFEKIDEVFGFPTKEKGEHVSPRLIFMLDYFSDIIAPGKVISMESGYRSPRYNSAIRDRGGNVARTSTHMDGMALDFSIEGVEGKELWEMIRTHECCGVGYYGGRSVHLDSSRPRFWEAATSKVRTGESDYNRRVYVSTDFDRYKGGDGLRLSLSSVSDFGFGMKRAVAVVSGMEGDRTAATAQITSADDNDCVMIGDRKMSRFIYLTLPGNIPDGRYRIKVDFCRRPFEQMPLSAVSNEFELSGKGPQTQ